MKASLRELLREIIDYAGLFPPAALELEPAIRNFARYRADSDAWMLARFICPAAKLAALKPFDAELFSVAPPLRFSVLGRGGDTAEAFLTTLEADLTLMRTFVTAHDGRAAVDAFEVKLPTDVVHTGDSAAVCGLLARMDQAFCDAKFGEVARFIEPPLSPQPKATVELLAEALAVHRYGESAMHAVEPATIVSGRGGPAGFKLRTGGLEAAAFPSPELVAFTIEQCRNFNLPLKFTAGLHHPLRRFDPGVRTMMHGFLNVFCASVLAHAVAFDLHDIQAVIEETDIRNFEFSDESIRWNDAEAMLDEIRFVRRDRCLSFGSCSFDEPREDLLGMRLM